MSEINKNDNPFMAAGAASAVQEKTDESPILTFEPFMQEAPAPEEAKPQEEPVEIDDSMLSEEEKKAVEQFSQQIDITNSAQVLQYGAGAQAKVADFSQKALDNVRTKDLGEVGNMIAGVVTELKSFDVDEEEKGIAGFFKKKANKLTSMKAKYQKAETNVNQITEALEAHQVTLMKDVAMLDDLYGLNMKYYKELTMYIIAGKKKIQQVKTVELPEMARKAEKSGLQEDAQAVSDMTALVQRFEKKIYDLELTRTIAMQMAPQIRLVQNNDVMMSDKIQSTIVNTIPLWKSQMVIALGIAHSEQAAKAQAAVSELTNDMLKANAAKLKQATISVAQESEKGIVEIETLKETNQQLISTLDEVLKIQTDGTTKRQAAEVELVAIEKELREKLLSMRHVVAD